VPRQLQIPPISALVALKERPMNTTAQPRRARIAIRPDAITPAPCMMTLAGLAAHLRRLGVTQATGTVSRQPMLAEFVVLTTEATT
jgi:hypothetical protein